MNVLIISPDAPPRKGGISRLVGLLTRGLEHSGHHVSALCPRFRIREFKLSSIPFHGYSKEYDMVHLHGPTPFLSDLTLITNKNSHIVYTHHAEVSWISERVSEVYRGFHKFLAKRARTVIVHSNEYNRLFTGYNVITVRLPSPIEAPKKKISLDDKADAFTVLFVGQFRPFKGIDMLIKSAALLKKVKFVMAGEGYLKPRFMSMARRLANINFADAKSDEELRQLYSMAHIVCLPSVNTTEAYGLVLLEGALYGCVPLASNLLGVRENVSLLKGLTFKKKSLTSLVRSIETLANDKDLWTTTALRSHRAACDYAAIHTPELYVKRHEEIYRKACQGG